jgi:hypothetical protein
MALDILQNFYKTTISTAWATGTGNRYVTTLPTPTAGKLVINPSNDSKREIITYTAVGTDGGGNYITVSARGVGGTTDQVHAVGEPVRMNLTAQHYSDIQTELDLKLDDSQLDTDGTLAANSDTKVASQKATKTYSDLRVLKSGDTMTGALILSTSSPSTSLEAASKGYADGLAIAGSPNASTTVKGIVEEATQAEFDASTDTGTTGARLFAVPSVVQTGITTKTFVAGEAITSKDAVFVAKGDEGRLINAFSTTRTTNENMGGTTWIYQSFTTSANTTSITRIKLWTGSSGNTPSNAGTVRLRATPTGADMTSATFGWGTQNANAEVTVDIPDTAVSPSTTYYLVVSVPSDSFITFYVQGGTTSTYSGGVSGISSNSGSSWTTPATNVTGDFYFEVLEGDYTAGRVYKTIASTTSNSGLGQTENFIGFANAGASAAANVAVKMIGMVTGLSGLTAGSTYYLSNTAGLLSLTPGTVSKKVGLALSATELLIKNDN